MRRHLSGLAAALAILAAAGTAAAGEWREASLRVDGTERWYRVYVPDALPRPAPLLLSLHGGTGSMHTIDQGPSHGWVRLAERERFLLLVPNGTRDGDGRGRRQNWNDLRDPGESQSQADDTGFLRALLDRVQAEYGSDPGRVYVTGNSNGGLMTYRLLVDMPERFAAAAAFIANLPVRSAALRPPARPVPLLIWSGTEDRLMKYAGGDIPGSRGRMRSVPDTVAWWLAANRAGAATPEALPDADPEDGCRIRRSLHAAGPDGAPVLFYLAEGGGHQMPTRTETTTEAGPVFQLLVGRTCRDVDGPEIAWEFMRGFVRRGRD